MKSPISILLLIAGLACLWGAARVHTSLLEWRVERSRETAVSLDRSSPLVVFTTVAIGGFRGVIADLLWMRIVRLQEEDKVFEMAQLADWVTKLEPRFTTVWAFHAWNMAYNISIRFPDYADRWRWVKNGIRLLRDEGLQYNPRNADLYRELGWIYQHKIGHYLDRAHMVYKRELARDMERLFDGPCPDYAAARHDPRLLRLKNQYKLDPDIMEKIDREYGPLDWRLPATHAIYWAYRGLQVAGSGISAIKCDHMLMQCMAESFRHGRLILDSRRDFYLATPNLDILPRVLKTYTDAIQRHPHEKLLRLAYENLLCEAAVILFAYNRIAAARDMYQRLIQQYPHLATTPTFEQFMLRSLKISIEQTPRRDAVALIEGFLVQYYIRAGRGDTARATAFENLAKLIWTRILESKATNDQWQRAGLVPLEDMRRQAFRRALAENPPAAQAAWLQGLAPQGSAVAGDM